MSHSTFLCKKKTCAFKYIFSTNLIPFKVCRRFLSSNTDTLTVYNKFAIFNFNFSIEPAMNGVVLKHISNIIYFEEVVDSNYFYIVPLKGSSERQTADPAKTVDTYFNF